MGRRFSCSRVSSQYLPQGQRAYNQRLCDSMARDRWHAPLVRVRDSVAFSRKKFGASCGGQVMTKHIVFPGEAV
jgi:hypothetical protein